MQTESPTLFEVNGSVTVVTKGNKVFLHICSELRARLKMMDMKFFPCPTDLTTPAIALEHMPM
jgi:hypothetical protein